MISHTTLTKVAELIKAIAESEVQAEVVRQVLCGKPSFEPYAAFQRVSQYNSSITSQRLLNFLAENDVFASKKDAYYLVRLFDSNGDGKLSYSEFLNIFLPKNDPALRKEVTNRKSETAGQSERLPYQVEHAMARIFEEELESYRNCEKVRQELVQSEDFTVMDAFRDIDSQDRGYINASMVAKFMEKVNEPFAEAQLEAFVLRADKNADGLIRYSEFLEIFYSAEAGCTEEKNEKSCSPTKGRADADQCNHIDLLRNTYGSPRKQYTASPSKVMRASNESFFSPMSTKASFGVTNASSMYKTPTRISPSKVVNEESANSVVQPAANGSTFSVTFSPKRDSPMKPREEAELVKAIKEMVEHIRGLETIKNNLALLKDFNSYNAFSIFDIERKGVINTRQLEQGFERLKVHVTKSDIALLMKRLDTDLDGLVKFGDFAHVICPKAGEFAKLLTSRDPNYVSDLEHSQDAFTEETLTAFKGFLIALVEEETLCESIRQRLVKRKAFNLHDAFKAIDRYDNGFVTAEHFKELLQENGLFASQKDVNTLVERYAKASKGKVSYYDFIKEMTPKSTNKY